MFKGLFASTMARTIGGLVTAALIVGGATAAIAAPTAPGQPVSTNGAADRLNNESTATPTSTATATPTPTHTATATTTASAHVDASETAESNSLFGLCNAWSRGSEKGQSNKHKATGFEKLVKAAGADGLSDADAIDAKVVDFCKTVAKPAETATATGNATATATPTATGTPTPTPTSGHGNNGHGRGNGNHGSSD